MRGMRAAGQQTVFVGLSGGVDSSVAAARLRDAGYHVVGVFIKVWHPGFLHCNWEQERLDAMRVCAALSIPFLTCDASERYKTGVVDYLVTTYTEGQTPNPDVMCNKYIKFGAFLDFADAHGTDYIATGHYARHQDVDGTAHLLRGTDSTKDQSYFLWTLTQTQLARTLFPIGDTEKTDIRAEATRHNLPTAEKPDSQGVCFLGELDMKSFLMHFIPQNIGKVEDVSGAAVGEHDGAYFYTIGQRHGFRLDQSEPTAAPYYIVAKDIKRNVLVVSHDKPVLTESAAHRLTLTDTNWIAAAPPPQVQIQTRYRQTPVAATVAQTSATTATITPTAPLDAPAVGQSCVVYDGDTCLGGGVIQTVTESISKNTS